MGDTGRNWDARLDFDDAPAEGQDTTSLVKLVERMPRAVELYLAVHLPELNQLLAATFPPLLRTLLIRTMEPFDLGILARNESLDGLKILVLHQEQGGDSIGASFHEDFAALVNSPGFDKVQNLRLDTPELDDTCCKALVGSRILKHLRKLWLRGAGLTNAGAAVLAASSDVQGLRALTIEGNLTTKGFITLRNAGVQILNTDDEIDDQVVENTPVR
jgi:hypothetical protein